MHRSTLIRRVEHDLSNSTGFEVPMISESSVTDLDFWMFKNGKSGYRDSFGWIFGGKYTSVGYYYVPQPRCFFGRASNSRCFFDVVFEDEAPSFPAYVVHRSRL